MSSSSTLTRVMRKHLLTSGLVVRGTNAATSYFLSNNSSTTTTRASFGMMQQQTATFATSSSSGGGKKKKNDDPKGIVPDDFFDEEEESEKEFLDMAASLVNSTGLESLTTVKESITWDAMETGQHGARSANKGVKLQQTVKASQHDEDICHEADNLSEAMESSLDDPDDGPLTHIVSNPDLADHLDSFYPKSFHLPADYMNYTVPWRKTGDFPHPGLDKFVGDTAPERYRHDRQGRYIYIPYHNTV